MTKSPFFLRVWFLSAATVVVAGTLMGASWMLYSKADPGATGFAVKLAELCLQLCVMVVLGGAMVGIVKLVWKWREEQQTTAADDAARQREQRAEFAKRARDVHVEVVQARDLLRAHKSPLTYSEQLQRLMRLRFVVEDLHADLEAAKNLFADADGILEALDGVVEILKGGAAEYEWAHNGVAGKWPAWDLEKTAKKTNMLWLQEFMGEGKIWQDYGECIAGSKGAIRAQVYGA